MAETNSKKLTSKKILPTIMIVPHGKTEIELSKFIINEFFHHKLKESGIIESEWPEIPRIIVLNEKGNIQSNIIKEKIVEHMEDELFITSNFEYNEIEKLNLFVIVMMDVKEKNLNNQIQEEELIKDDCNAIVKESLLKKDLSGFFGKTQPSYLGNSLNGVKMIYFEKSVEKHFVTISDGEIKDGQNKKHYRMRRFLKTTDVTNYESLKDFLGKIECDLDNNIIKILEFLETIFQELLDFLKN